jgi:hypothetical protein
MVWARSRARAAAEPKSSALPPASRNAYALTVAIGSAHAR